MSDLAAFLSACVSSPALLTSACALLVVPPLAWAVVRMLGPSLERMPGDPAWQAALAAGAAALPGLLSIVIGAATLRGGLDSACLQFTTGRMLYGGIAVVTALGVARAVWLAVRRARDVRRLVRQSFAADARARSAAQFAGVSIREIDVPGPVVLLAGLFQPVVLISTEALRRVNDAELHAAIRHEAAHARRGDLLCAAVITFVSELVPFPVGRLLALFRHAREFAADAYAIRTADPCDLAAALLALARPACIASSVAALADAGTVRDRLGLLLAPAQPRHSVCRRVLLTAALAATFVLGAAPVLTALALGFGCSMAMPA